MKAWYITAPNHMELKDVEEPVMKDGFVKVELLTIQPSVTETAVIACKGDMFGLSERVKAGEMMPVPGHELCARVIESGPNSAFKPGDRVASIAKTSCGECAKCRSGNPQLCVSMGVLGWTFGVVFAERVLLPESGLVLVPEELTNQEGACLQPMSDCVGAVDTARIKVGDTVAFYGAGCLGLNAMQVARSSGAGKLIVVDVRDDVLEMAKKLGAHHVINGKKQDPVKAILDLTGGIGADVVFEGAGGPGKGLGGTSVLGQAVKSLKPEANLVIMALYGPTIEIPFGEMRYYAKNLVMPTMTTVTHMAQAARLISSGQLQLKPIITHSVNGLDKVPEAFEITANKGERGSIMPAQVNIKK